MRVNMQRTKPNHSMPFHDVRDPNANPSCRHCKQALDMCECIRGQNELLQRNVTNTYAVAAKLDTKALRDISALATQTAAVVAVLVATISYTSLLSPPSGWTAPEKARSLHPCSRVILCFHYVMCFTCCCCRRPPAGPRRRWRVSVALAPFLRSCSQHHDMRYCGHMLDQHVCYSLHIGLQEGILKHGVAHSEAVIATYFHTVVL